MSKPLNPDLPDSDPTPASTASEPGVWELDVPAAESVPASAPPGPTLLSPPPWLRIIEAILFVGGPPLTAGRAAEAIRGLTSELFTQAIDTLNRDYRRQRRPYSVRAQDQGYALVLRPQFMFVVEKLYGTNREARLSLAAIDVLSIVAYRQPIGKQEIDTMRGIESGALLRQLVRRGLIAVLPRQDAKNQGAMYVTTKRFLDQFGLKSIEELPQTQDLQAL